MPRRGLLFGTLPARLIIMDPKALEKKLADLKRRLQIVADRL